MPPHLIGEAEQTATYESVEQFNMMFAVQCIHPLLALLEGGDPARPHREFAVLRQVFDGGAATRSPRRFAAYHLALRDDWITEKELRALEDRSAILDEIGTKDWRSVNWTTLDSTEPPTNAVSGGSDDDPGDPSSGDGLQST